MELLELKKSGIRVAAYMTEVPSVEVLQKKLHQLVERARLETGRPALRQRGKT